MTAANAPERLVVQASWINDAEFIGHFIAAEEGYYAAAGLDVVHVPGHAGLVPEQTLITGEASIALAAPESVAATVAATGISLKIIGAQFQRSPLGIISLASRPITGPVDIRGRTLAVPEMNLNLVRSVRQLHEVEIADVRIVAHHHDLEVLLTGDVDGIVDFVADAQFKLQTLGASPFATLLHDHGATLFNNVVVVREDFLDRYRQPLRNWLRATRTGWELNASDPDRYPALLQDSWLKGNGRSLENESFANRIYAELVASPSGIFAMDRASIDANISFIRSLGISVDAGLFDASLIDEL
jgi:ABC-type nitrate/sulfonate/bicarbonate transport system substrate-binding protein